MTLNYRRMCQAQARSETTPVPQAAADTLWQSGLTPPRRRRHPEVVHQLQTNFRPYHQHDHAGTTTTWLLWTSLRRIPWAAASSLTKRKNGFARCTCQDADLRVVFPVAFIPGTKTRTRSTDVQGGLKVTNGHAHLNVRLATILGFGAELLGGVGPAIAGLFV